MLNYDTLQIICSFLEHTELIGNRAVSKQWNNVCNDKNTCKYAKFTLRNINDLHLALVFDNIHVLPKTGINDVSMLGGVHTLKLRECKQITDVSALGGVHTLIR